MSTIDPLSSILAPFRALPAAEIKLTWRDNTAGTKELSYGDRLPASRGYQLQHDHSELGGIHLGMALGRFCFGPYERAKGEMDAGFPICPPTTGLSFVTGQAKLLASVPVRILGGVTGVNVDLLLSAELSTSPQSMTLGVVLRPLGLVNFNDFIGSIAESAFVFGHLKKLTHSYTAGLTKQRATFTDLSRLGNGIQHRLAELCFFLMSDLSANNRIDVCASSVLVSAVTTDVSAYEGSPDQEVALVQIVAGQPLTTGLGSQAKARGNALHLTVIGATPGYVNGVQQEASPFVQELTGAHEHQGLRILQEDGTVRSDGALLPYSLFGQAYPREGESGTDTFLNANPCTGLPVSRSAVIGQESVFFQEIPVSKGARAIRFMFALRPETTSPVNRLALRAHLCRSNVAPSVSNNILLSVEGFAAIDSDGFVVGTVQPRETPGYQWSGSRPGLGLWTLDALEPQASSGVRLTNAYRVSSNIELRLTDTVRITEPYTLRYAFLLYFDQNETALDPLAGLLWAHGYAEE